MEMNSRDCSAGGSAPRQLVGDGRRVLDLRLLQVEVDRVQPVGRDDLLVRGGGRGRRAAHLAQLGAVVAARGDDHVAAVGADLIDDAGDLGIGGDRVGPVPGGRARAPVGQDEGHVERLLAGRGHYRADVRRARVQRAVIRSRFVPVGRQRGGGGGGPGGRRSLAPGQRGGGGRWPAGQLRPLPWRRSWAAVRSAPGPGGRAGGAGVGAHFLPESGQGDEPNY